MKTSVPNTGATASFAPVTSGRPNQSRSIGENAKTGIDRARETQNRRRNSSA
jgi:hypothetical protein